MGALMLRPFLFAKPLPFTFGGLRLRGGVGVGSVSVAPRPIDPTPLRLGIKDAKSRCLSTEEEGIKRLKRLAR